MDRQTAALLERAAALRRAGRVEQAIAAYEELLENAPELAESWYNLGWLQRQARQYDAALDSYAQALKRGVSGAEEVHLNRAVILSDHLARPKDAKAELEAALKLKPDYLPALLNLGNLNEDLGDRRGAEWAYRRALEVEPEDALALSRLSGVVDATSAAGAELAVQLRDGLAQASDPAARADLGFALGRLLDARGDHDEAFRAYESANRASRDSFGQRFRGYDPAAQEAFVDRTIAAFASASDAEADDSPAVFVLGLFRSGSTLVEQIIAGHSGVVSGGELDLVPALAATIADYPQAVPSADDNTLERWRSFYRDGLRPLNAVDSKVTDKRPDNFLHIGLIKTLFPTARIIHTRRNRLDNLLSLYFLHLGESMPYALDLTDAQHWHGEYERLMAHWKRLYGNDILDVDYDELVREPQAVIDEVLDFLGLAREASLLDFHSRSSVVKTASVWQVREPLHARSSGRWKNYEGDLRRALGDRLGG
jgi:tetratricopeptide (TPR) repeat protein